MVIGEREKKGKDRQEREGKKRGETCDEIFWRRKMKCRRPSVAEYANWSTRAVQRVDGKREKETERKTGRKREQERKRDREIER